MCRYAEKICKGFNTTKCITNEVDEKWCIRIADCKSKGNILSSGTSAGGEPSPPC